MHNNVSSAVEKAAAKKAVKRQRAKERAKEKKPLERSEKEKNERALALQKKAESANKCGSCGDGIFIVGSRNLVSDSVRRSVLVVDLPTR